MLEVKKLPKGKIIDIEFVDDNSLPETIEPHRHEYYEIFWVLEGSGAHSIDFEKYPLESGKIYFIRSGQIHHVHTLPKKMYSISFTSEIINHDLKSQQLLEQLFSFSRSLHPEIIIDRDGELALLPLINVMSKEITSDDIDNEFINYIFTGFLKLLARYLPNPDNEKIHDNRVLELLALIDKNSYTYKHVDFYADKLSLSSKRVNQLTQKHLKKTVTQLIHDKLITDAKRRLIYSSCSVKNIALELGFKDVGYFCRFYKNVTSISPQKYREKCNGF